MSQQIPAPLHTIRAAFAELSRRVSVALRTQLGDTARLQHERTHCQRLLSLLPQARANPEINHPLPLIHSVI